MQNRENDNKGSFEEENIRIFLYSKLLDKISRDKIEEWRKENKYYIVPRPDLCILDKHLNRTKNANDCIDTVIRLAEKLAIFVDSLGD